MKGGRDRMSVSQKHGGVWGCRKFHPGSTKSRLLLSNDGIVLRYYVDMQLCIESG